MSTLIGAEKVAEQEASFRSSLEDVIIISEGLSKNCKTVEGLIGVCRLALEDDGLLRTIMSWVLQAKNK